MISLSSSSRFSFISTYDRLFGKAVAEVSRDTVETSVGSLSTAVCERDERDTGVGVGEFAGNVTGCCRTESAEV